MRPSHICRHFGSPTMIAALVLALVSTGMGSPIELGMTMSGRATSKFAYGTERVRGVNLGGWLVLEPWITPSLFAEFATPAPSVVDEYTYTATLGAQEATRRLQTHWNTWITRDDLQAIKNAGLNHIRVPIGYWSILPIAGEPFIQGAYAMLGNAIGWANEVGLKVMIDLHGGPGSQNGFDNSGRYGSINWGTAENVAYTLNVINKIRDDFASNPAVSAIQLINEPANWGVDIGLIRQFYTDGYNSLRNSDVAVVIHDAFMPLASWGDFGADMPNLVLDTHHYEVFDNNQLAMDLNGHIGSACAYGNQMAGTGKVTISGEWTGAMTDCAKWLNGLSKGARYDGTLAGSSYIGSCAGSKTEGPVSGLNTVDTRRFIEAQLDGYEKAGGWVFWTWKTESAPDWDMQDLLAAGVFPNPVTTRNYPGQCA